MIPDEAVEAAARAIYELQPARCYLDGVAATWEELDRVGTGLNRKSRDTAKARAALEAAAPHLRKETGRGMKHARTDPACIHYKETGRFRRYLNLRGHGTNCNACVPAALRSLAEVWDEGFRRGNFWHGWISNPTTFAPDFSNPYRKETL